MRPIKFRAWNKRTKEMKEVLRIFFNENAIEVYKDSDNFDNATWFLDYCELMQFTGLQDKNGNDIYEGDVMRIAQFTFHVSYDQGCFVVQENTKSEIYFSLSNINTYSEIIGNIHEY